MKDFLKNLNLPVEIEKKLSFEKAILKKRNSTEFLIIELISNNHINSTELLKILKKINGFWFNEQKLLINNFKIKHKNIEYKIDQIYSIINTYIKTRLESVEMKNIFLKEEEDSFKLVASDSRTYNEVRKVLPEIKHILSEFSFTNKILQLIQDGSFFDKEKIIQKRNQEILILEENSKKNTSSYIANGYKQLNFLDLEKEKTNVYFKGYIFNVLELKTKRNNKLTKFLIEKNGNAIEVVLWGSKDSEKNFKIGDHVLVYGDWKYNLYSKNFSLNVKSLSDIEKFPEDELNDKEIKKTGFKRSELHTHTKMSVMDGVADVASYFKFANKNEITSIAFTDHNSVQSFPDIDKLSNSFPNIKPIYGVEFNVKNDFDNKIVINEQNKLILEAEYVFFDLETTGISPFLNEIIEFGAVKQKDGRIIDRIQLFIKPNKTIPEHITKLTSITNYDVKDAPTIKEALQIIKDWIGDSILVAHNAYFDYSFLDSFYRRYGFGKLKNTVIDTLKISWLLNKKLRNHRLGTIAKVEGVDYHDEIAHRADYDAEVLHRIFENMINKLLELKIRNIIDLNKKIPLISDRIFENHITILAKNSKGIKDIYKLISKSHIDRFNKLRKEPSLFFSDILEKRENLLIGSSCNQGILWEKINYDSFDLDDFVKKFDYLEIFPPSSYLNLLRDSKYSKDDIKKIIKKIIDLGKKNNISVVVTSNSHYVEKNDKSIRDVYITNKGLGGKLHPLFDRRNPNLENPQNHLRTIRELFSEFSFLKNNKLIKEIIIDNPNKISNKIENLKSMKRGLFPPKIEGIEKKFKEIVFSNLEKIYGKNPDKLILNRVNHEMNSIVNNDYSIIYYLSSLLVKKSLDDGYLVGSRGSVGSSLVATFCEITEVNPLPPHYVCKECQYHKFVDEVDSGFDLPNKKCPKCNSPMKGDGHNIPFETFLGFEGDKVPDIDLNFSREYQSKIHNYARDILGKENVYRAGTISTVAEKTAFGYVKNYIETTNKESEFNVPKITLFSKKAEGVKRTTGQHPGGLIVVPSNMEIYDFTPINFPGNDLESNWLTTHFDFSSIHDNLLKLDLLGHLDPSIIRMLQNLTKVDPRDIPMNDKGVLSLFNDSKLLKYKENKTNEKLGIIGIPEFGTKFVRDLVRDTKPNTFADLIRISGLSHGTNVWVGNAKDLIDKKIAVLKDVISVRDDIMTYLISKGLDSFVSFKIMESVRKGKSITQEWEEIMIKHNIPEWYIESCKKIKYIFPKAHATAYVIMAFRIAWYKINFPLEYYATFFTKRDNEWDIDSLYKGIEGILGFKSNYKKSKPFERTDRDRDINETYDIVLEMYSRGYTISKISLEKSRTKKWIVDKENKSLIPPFTIIEGLGEAVAKKMVDARDEKNFEFYEDFSKRSGLNKTLLSKFNELEILKNLKKEKKENKQMFITDIFNV